MNEKEIAEIRRRYKPDKNNISRIRGCYVNETGEIISEFNQSLALTAQEETEKLLAILKKALSGTTGRNLIDISFETKQVVEGEEHALLTALRDSRLEDDDAVQALYRKILTTVMLEGSYMILLAHDTYDVPFRTKDGERMDDASTDVYSYVLCAVCPVKLTKPALSYYVDESEFHSLQTDWIVGAPEIGFLFPAFDDRCTNLYGALYYTRDITKNQTDFVDTLFRAELPMPAAAQKDAFDAVLGESLAEECSCEVVQAVHEGLRERIEEHKDNAEEPLVVTKQEVKAMLGACGVSDSRVAAFDRKYDEEFGADAGLSPRNLIETGRLEVRTPDVVIRVNAERGDLLETRVIDGVQYILIRADEGVEVNGVDVRIR